jgi:hypothetical protein
VVGCGGGTGTEASLTLWPVSGFDGLPVVIKLGGWTWQVVGVDRLSFDDVWMARPRAPSEKL